MARRTQGARQDDVAVQNAAHGIANGFVKVVAFHQHRKEARNRALRHAAGALADLGQQVEDRRRVALLARRLARR